MLCSRNRFGTKKGFELLDLLEWGLNEKEHDRTIRTLILSSALWYTTDEINQYS
jgi:hypothetical protein